MVVDAGNAQLESNENNNQISRSIALNYPPLPDLAVHEVIAPQFVLAGGDSILSWTVTNRGTLAVTNAWTDLVSISNAVQGTRSLAEFRITNSLLVAQSLTRTQTVSLPPDLLAGSWRFLVTTDSRGDAFESNESNNTTASATNSEVPLALTLTLPVTELLEGAPGVLATVTRNGDRSSPLSITITNGDPTEIEVTNSVVIPAGQSGTTFLVRPLLDGIVDGAQFVTIGVGGTNYRGATASLNVQDIDVPRLLLLLTGTNLIEGATMSAIVTRDYATNRDLTVVLYADDPAQLKVPVSLLIPSNQLSAPFSIIAVDNTLVEPSRTNRVIALAGGFQSATGTVVILDNDLPSVGVSLAAHSVSEGAGAQATFGTVTRSPVTPRPLTVQLTSMNPGSAIVPPTVTIPGGQASVSFPIGTVDNELVDGNRTALIRVFVLDSYGNVIAEGTPDTLQVLDDDGPTLKLAIARDLVAEGQDPATTATISRNTSTNAPLTVTLTTSDTGELTAPGTAIIPAGQSSVTVNLATPLDHVPDGNKSVTVTASASGFTSGSDVVIVSDIDLPDLAISHVTVPTNGFTDGTFTLTYRIDNLGIAACTSNFTTRVWLSKDTYLENDTLLGDFPFTGTLPVGLFIEQTSQFQLPATPGKYWIIIDTDVNGQVAEGLKNNNTFVTALPIDVKAAYTATVETPVTTALAGTSIPMSGSAVRAGSGLPAANVPVNIHILLRGTRRLLLATTDNNGNFTATFTPLPGEAGVYQIGAAHPGASDASHPRHLHDVRFETRIANPNSESDRGRQHHRRPHGGEPWRDRVVRVERDGGERLGEFKCDADARDEQSDRSWIQSIELHSHGK